ncbi:4Fe-4S dicluster domain-containing protein [Helicobacter cholecystus]|nr:4Fe-4S dicluster domain-containing protein [Helicobacter cholecystus]VEJ23961.1 anaerobic glycerol-3-phosphate dehydrogenase (G-3-P dehydrogenase) [Helicobacter cholecystus]
MHKVCIKCAKCNPICPTFLLSGDETYSPRGYLHLCSLPAFPSTSKILSTCTLCKECEKLCPIKLPITQTIEKKLKELSIQSIIS